MDKHELDTQKQLDTLSLSIFLTKMELNVHKLQNAVGDLFASLLKSNDFREKGVASKSIQLLDEQYSKEFIDHAIVQELRFINRDEILVRARRRQSHFWLINNQKADK